MEMETGTTRRSQPQDKEIQSEDLQLVPQSQAMVLS